VAQSGDGSSANRLLAGTGIGLVVLCALAAVLGKDALGLGLAALGVGALVISAFERRSHVAAGARWTDVASVAVAVVAAVVSGLAAYLAKMANDTQKAATERQERFQKGVDRRQRAFQRAVEARESTPVLSTVFARPLRGTSRPPRLHIDRAAPYGMTIPIWNAGEGVAFLLNPVHFLERTEADRSRSPCRRASTIPSPKRLDKFRLTYYVISPRERVRVPYKPQHGKRVWEGSPTIVGVRKRDERDVWKWASKQLDLYLVVRYTDVAGRLRWNCTHYTRSDVSHDFAVASQSPGAR